MLFDHLTIAIVTDNTHKTHLILVTTQFGHSDRLVRSFTSTSCTKLGSNDRFAYVTKDTNENRLWGYAEFERSDPYSRTRAHIGSAS